MSHGQPPPYNELRSPAYAARQLGVDRRTIHRWIAKGLITFEEVGPFKRRRIRDSEIARLNVCRVA